MADSDDTQCAARKTREKRVDLCEVIDDTNDRLGDCRVTVEMSVEAMLTSSDPQEAIAQACGALTLAAKEIKRIQEELDEASSKAGRPKAVRLMRAAGVEVANG